MDIVSNYKIGDYVFLIDANGDKLGTKVIKEAVYIAKTQGMDIVKIADGSPPVAKVVDINKYQYELKKKEKERAKMQRESRIDLKELHFKPTTEEYDIIRFAHQATDFLAEGHKVKLTVKIKGRLQNNPELTKNALDVFFNNAKNYKIDSRQNQPNSVMIILSHQL
jgi:translation initiation factor IF-3